MCAPVTARGALDDARLQSLNHGPQVVAVVTGRQNRSSDGTSTAKGYEYAEEVWAPPHAEVVHERGNEPPG